MNPQNKVQIALTLLGGGILSTLFIIQQNPAYGNLLLYASLLISGLAYLYACRMSQEMSSTGTTMFGSVILIHLLVIPLPVFFSDDVFRYIWDGLVQANAVNPYLYTPGSEEVFALRRFSAFEYMRDQFGIYSHFSPVYQVIFRFSIYLEGVLGFQGMIFFYKFVSILINLGIIKLLADVLEKQGKQQLVYWYAWNPVIIILICGQGLISHLPALLFLYLIIQWKSPKTDTAGILWGILLHLSFFFWLALPALIRKWGWKFAGLAMTTWLAWWLPLLSADGISNYFEVLWFNLHTPPENLSAFSLIYLLSPAVSKIYAGIFLLMMVAASWYLAYTADDSSKSPQLTTLAALGLLYFIFQPVWNPGFIAILLPMLLLTKCDKQKAGIAALLLLLGIPLIVESSSWIYVLNFIAAGGFIYLFYPQRKLLTGV